MTGCPTRSSSRTCWHGSISLFSHVKQPWRKVQLTETMSTRQRYKQILNTRYWIVFNFTVSAYCHATTLLNYRQHGVAQSLNFTGEITPCWNRCSISAPASVLMHMARQNLSCWPASGSVRLQTLQLTSLVLSSHGLDFMPVNSTTS